MATNVRILSKRKLPPLDPHHRVTNLPYNLKFITKNAVMDSLDYNDLPSDIITKYLDNNQIFLENYLLNNLKFRASYKIGSMADSLTNEAPFDGVTQHISLELKKSASGTKSDIILFNEYQSKISFSSYQPFNDRHFFIHKLTTQFDETFPRASILKSLYECMMQGFDADEIKFYLMDAKNEIFYLYDPFLMNNEFQSKEVFPRNSLTSLAAAAAFYKTPVLYPNMRMNMFPRFHKFKSDKIIMAQPITDYNGTVYGVFELIRNKDKTMFNKSDEELAVNFITWGCIALFFTEILQKHSQQQQLNNFIMKVTQTMFGNFKHMDYVIMDIMKYAKHIVKAQRSAFFIVEKETKEIVAQIFDVGNENDVRFKTEKNNIRFPIGIGIAGHVAATGEILNIRNAYDDIRFNRDIDLKTGYQTKTVVAIPVKLKNETVGVLQIVNKVDGHFTDSDEDHLTTFANYCGIALYIAKMYRRIRHSEQRYKVALDVLSYHSGYDLVELNLLSIAQIPKEWSEMAEYYYCPWDIDETKQLVAFLFMFRTLFGIFNIEEKDNLINPKFSEINLRFERKTLMRFILTVKKNYRNVPYHNWSHAFTVGQSMFCMLMNTSHEYTLIESLALFIGCFCHDLDHRGKTNEYIVKSDTALGSLYTTSTMEHHHFNMTVSILQRDEHNIFEHMNSIDYKTVLDLLKHDILATDLNRFFVNNVKVSKIIENNEIDWKNFNHRYTFMELFMTSADLSAMYKPWDMQLDFVKVIMQEFWDQGDLEKKEGSTPARMMDRLYNYELPAMEIGFISFICLPCYTSLDKIVSGAFPIVSGLQKNLDQWKSLKDLPKEEIIKMFS